MRRRDASRNSPAGWSRAPNPGRVLKFRRLPAAHRRTATRRGSARSHAMTARSMASASRSSEASARNHPPARPTVQQALQRHFDDDLTVAISFDQKPSTDECVQQRMALLRQVGPPRDAPHRLIGIRVHRRQPRDECVVQSAQLLGTFSRVRPTEDCRSRSAPRGACRPSPRSCRR